MFIDFHTDGRRQTYFGFALTHTNTIRLHVIVETPHYWPIVFNYRKQMKVKGTFSNLVKGAKKGAAKGNKSRVHQKRKK